MRGDVDIAKTAALVAEPARARILLTLGDGRALPASVLAAEAGVAPSTASAHLGKLVSGGLITVQRHGRHRYFALAGPTVAELVEALARLSPATEVRSLRQDTRAGAIRTARTCYDHLAGILGTGLMALLERELLAGGDGLFVRERTDQDRLSSPGSDLDYRITERGVRELEAFGVELRATGA
ncbi:MAG: helix-turn-helix domain-containing protein [Actinomycetota bacterium]|nr:helix-turn-helix domain-containing protein [Actinomycetota bacterium]